MDHHRLAAVVLGDPFRDDRRVRDEQVRLAGAAQVGAAQHRQRRREAQPADPAEPLAREERRVPEVAHRGVAVADVDRARRRVLTFFALAWLEDTIRSKPLRSKDLNAASISGSRRE